MRNKHVKPTGIIRIPELQIGPVWKKFINIVSKIRYVHWLIGISILLILFCYAMPESIRNDLWLRIKAQKTLVIMILIFCFISVSLIWKTGERIDVWVFMVFNMHGRRAPWVDWLMLGITQLGNGIFAVAVAAVFFLRDNRMLTYEIILGTLTLWLVVELMKILIRRKRPYKRLDNIRIIGARAGGHSFPSGHTSQAFFMATMFFNHFNPGLLGGMVFYTVALIVGITRIYVGMHYPRDVLGGSMLGTAWGLFGAVINQYIH